MVCFAICAYKSTRFLPWHATELRFEFKTEIDAVKLSIKDVEKSLTYTQSEVEGLKEHFEMERKEHSKEVDTLNEKIADLEDGLKQEVENNIALEEYTRRKNLSLNNNKEKEHEDCRVVVYNILEKELGVDTTKIRFHAVHRVGKKIYGRSRPILVRFVCWEDRDKVWSVRGKIRELKHATFLSHRRTPEVYCFPILLVFTLPHLYFKSLCASRDDYFENLGETNVLACKMFTSGCRPWLKNVACLSSLIKNL